MRDEVESWGARDTGVKLRWEREGATSPLNEGRGDVIKPN